MKIILCIFLLNITAVSVFGKPQELNGTLGKSIEFPAAVKKDGSLMYGTLIIGEVARSSFGMPRHEKYRDRLQWDSSTGFFSLPGLKMEDIGKYEVKNTDQNIITVFQLNVHDAPVSKPLVSITHNEYPCTIECTAERGTLSWYREGQKKSFASSHGESAPHLNMTVERSGTYTCEAKNSVSRKTSDPLTVGAHCTDPAFTNRACSCTGMIVASVIAALAVPSAVVFAVLYCCIRRKLQDDAVQPVPQSDDAVQPVPQSGFEGRCKGDFIIFQEETNIMASSHQTEVL